MRHGGEARASERAEDEAQRAEGRTARAAVVLTDREADLVSKAYRTNEHLPAEKVDLSSNEWRTVRLAFKGDNVDMSVDGKWQRTLKDSMRSTLYDTVSDRYPRFLRDEILAEVGRHPCRRVTVTPPPWRGCARTG